MRAKWLTIALTLAAFVAAIFLLRFVPQQFFPASDRPELMVDLTLRQNASIYATEATGEAARGSARQGRPDVDHWSTYVGRGAIRFFLPLNVQLAEPVLRADRDRRQGLRRRASALQQKLEKLLAEEFPGRGRARLAARARPAGRLAAAVPRQRARTRTKSADIALELAQVIAADPRTRHVNYDWMEPARQLRVKIDQDQARRLGVSSRALAAVLNAAVTGSTVTQVRDDIYLVNVVARATDDQRASLDDAALAAGADAERAHGAAAASSRPSTYEQEYPLVWRRDRVPTLTVRADVAPGVLPDAVVGALGAEGRRVRREAAAGPTRSTPAASSRRARRRSASVFAVVPLMILLMLTDHDVPCCVSFRRLAMVVALLPLGLIGVVLALLVFNRPLGFVAILGILALIGMIAKNAVILIVQIETDRAEGKSVRDAVIAAATSRLRPMMLTAFSTVLGLIPIAPTVFWGPMAFAIMGGLLVATLLTLVFLPVLYVTVFGNEKTATAAAQAG